MEKLLEAIKRNENVRQCLISLKQELKNETEKKRFQVQTNGNYDFIMKLLIHEDPKVRKNAANILGMLKCQDALEVLADAYEAEETLFVRSEYLKAMAQLDCSGYLGWFHDRLDVLTKKSCSVEEKKHVQEEIQELQKLLLEKEGIKKHTFQGYQRQQEVILTTIPAFREITASQIAGGPVVKLGVGVKTKTRDLQTFQGYQRQQEVILTTIPAFREITASQIAGGPVVKLGVGVKTKTRDLQQILKIRTYKELLFVLHGTGELTGTPEDIAQGLWSSDLMELLQENHLEAGPYYFRLGIIGPIPLDQRSRLAKKLSAAIEERFERKLINLQENHLEAGPYYFRLGIIGPIPLDQRSRLAKKLSAAIEERFERKLINSASHYEVEIRLVQKKEGGFYSFLKLYTIPDHRFDYRKYTVAAGMQPFMAAGILHLAQRYLTEHAQVLDPFCGAGTLLIERNYLNAARDCYGVDIFGEAIERARVNTKIAKMNINYINRDFSDFSHDYLFDEVITDMPVKGSMSFDELEALYEMFFSQAAKFLKKNGVIILHSSEMGFVKKYIRLHREYHLEREYCLSEKNKMYLFILIYRGEETADLKGR